MMNTADRIFIAGHLGLVGSAIVRNLQRKGYTNILTQTREELELLNQKDVYDYLAKEKPDVVIVAAAKVGGILANMTYPAEFIAENLIIETNLVRGAYLAGVKRLLFLGSSCIYPRLAPQPIPESALLTGPLEETNAPYAIAKIAGISLCNSFNKEYGTRYRCVMPTNLYGPGDSFHPQHSHVLPALILKFHEAKMKGSPSVTVWGTGEPRREFLFVDDLADACVYLLEKDPSMDLINIGTGEDIRIQDLAMMIARVVGFTGSISFDPSKPDGTPQKLLNVDALHATGWKHQVALEDGIRMTYKWFCEHNGKGS
jgi:GDP-L-fucose synthase